MNDKTTKINIKDLPEEDRPREKLKNIGVHSLSDAELLAILIGSGTREETSVQLCQRIIHSVSNNLNALGKHGYLYFQKNFKGIGEAKAITIVAALELGRRRKESEKIVKKQIKSSKDVFEIMHPLMADLPNEQMWVILLNQANRIIRKTQIGSGGISGVVADIRIILKEALDYHATTIVLCHNHPAGTLQSSPEDDNFTYRIKNACNIMDIRILDHVIITDNGYFSYLEHGKL